MRLESEPYNPVFKAIHWITALLVIGLLSAGFIMTGMAVSPLKLSLYGLHKSFGITVFILCIARIVWRRFHAPPAPLKTHAPWERHLAHLVHMLLYGGLIVMPLSGWFMSSAGGFPATFFNMVALPDLTGKNEILFKAMRTVHEVAAFAVLGALCLHGAGAFKHHIIDRDATLQRMSIPGTGFIKPLIMPVTLIAVSALLALFMLRPEKVETSVKTTVTTTETAEDKVSESTAQSNVPHWIIDHENSHIRFEATQYGQTFDGVFPDFDGTIIFDPDNLEGSRVDIEIDIGRISTGSADRDSQAQNHEWFDTGTFPRAYFKSDHFKTLGQNRFMAHGYLTIRNVSSIINFPFILEFYNPYDSKNNSKKAVVHSAFTVNRSVFGVGQGERESGEVIGHDVRIILHLEAFEAQDVPST